MKNTSASLGHELFHVIQDYSGISKNHMLTLEGPAHYISHVLGNESREDIVRRLAVGEKDYPIEARFLDASAFLLTFFRPPEYKKQGLKVLLDDKVYEKIDKMTFYTFYESQLKLVLGEPTLLDLIVQWDAIAKILEGKGK